MRLPLCVKLTSPLWREQGGFKRHVSEGDHAVTRLCGECFSGGGGLKLKMKMNSSKKLETSFQAVFTQRAACCDISNENHRCRIY